MTHRMTQRFEFGNTLLGEMIARSFRELRSARSQCLSAPSEISTVAMLEFQIEIRERLLNSISAIRLLLARHMASEPSSKRPRSVLRKRKTGRSVAARRVKRARVNHVR